MKEADESSNNHNLMHALLFPLLLHPESTIKVVMFVIWGESFLFNR